MTEGGHIATRVTDTAEKTLNYLYFQNLGGNVGGSWGLVMKTHIGSASLPRDTRGVAG